jgi:hypothetical protein
MENQLSDSVPVYARWRRAFERSPVMGDLVESFWLYGKDGAKYRAYIHQERISASSLDGPVSILGPKTARLAHTKTQV